MNIRHRLLAGLCLAAFAMPADAATWVVTYQGTLGTTRVEDQNGQIVIDPSLFGTAFTATFTVDDSLGTLNIYEETDPMAVLEGTAADNPVHGTLKFGSTTYSFGSYVGTDERYSRGAGADFISTSSEHFFVGDLGDTYGVMRAYAYVSDGTLSTSNLGKAFTATPLRGSGGQAFWYTYNMERNGFDEYFDTTFNVSSVSVAALAAVPEPATWGMMILGFGLVGGAIRRARPGRAAAFG